MKDVQVETLCCNSKMAFFNENFITISLPLLTNWWQFSSFKINKFVENIFLNAFQLSAGVCVTFKVVVLLD